MITSYEVGSVFRIIDEASPVLTRLAIKFGELDAIVVKTHKSLSSFSSARFTGLGTKLKAINEQMSALGISSEKAATIMAAGVGAMGKEFDEALIGARALKTEMGEIAAMSRTIAKASIPTPGGHVRPGGGGSSRHGGVGFGSVSAPLPGGSHMHLRGNAALAGAGLIGYGVYEEAQMHDAISQILYHAEMQWTPENKNKFRDIIQKTMSETGYDLKDVAEAAKTETRMFKGVPGGGLDVMQELLKAAAIESRLKGSSLQESMNSLIGLAHMTKEYSPEEIKKLAPAFAFLSASNPARLGSMEKAASYAVPILQSGLEIDPMQSLLLGTVLTRAGATNTKSGTWLRNMLLKAMDSPANVMAVDEKLKSLGLDPMKENPIHAFGLADEKGKPTWFTSGKPDPFKMLEIAGERAPGIPLERRAEMEKSMFGVQGFGAFALLADPAVKEQLKAMRKEMDSEGFKNRYGGFMKEYSEESPVQKFRETWADLKNVLMDIGSIVLPAVVVGLKGFDDGLKWIKENINPAIDGVKGIGAAVYNLVPSASEAVHAMMDLGNLIKGFFGGIVEWLKDKIGGLFSRTSYDGGGVGGGYGGGIIKASLGGANDNGGMQPGFKSNLDRMMADAHAQGVPLSISSGYRSQAHQNALFARSDGSGHWVARHSNHTRGIAADLRGDLGWAHRHASEYGLHFPMPWEKWHIEPQGSRGGHVAAYVKPHDSKPQILHVMLDGEVIHRSVVKHERRATEHSHQAPSFDGYHDYSAPDGQIWAA